MNFKNNNLKKWLQSFKKEQMIEAVKKNKVPVMLTGFALFVMISFGILIYGMGQQEKSQEMLFIEEKAQLADMTSYLDEIGEVVSINQDRLAHSMLFQSDTEQTLLTYQEQLSLLENDLMQVETIMQRHTNTESIINSEVSISLTELSECHQEIKSQIASIHGGITELLSSVRHENDEHFSTTFDRLKKLQKDLDKTQEDAKSYYDSLTEILTAFEEGSESQNDELTNQLLTIQTELNEFLKVNFDSLQLKLEESYLSLMQELDDLQNQVENTQLSITNLLGLMEEADQNRQEEIEAAFTSVNSSIELIRTEYNSAHANLENLIQTVQETQVANHEETLSVLSEVEINLEEVSLENLEQLSNSLQVIEENFSNSITSMQNHMNKNFSELNTELKNNFFQTNSDITNKLDEMNTSIFNQHEELSTNISNQYQEMSTTIVNNNGEQQESFDNLMTYLEQKLSQVFTYVSDGKKRVVSALLTKGVDLNEDATFAQIHDGILGIDQEIVIGVEQIPGDITYQYHYHIDGKSQYPHTVSCPLSDKGGCYITPVYHYHIDSDGTAQAASYTASTKGGCFVTNVYHAHVGVSTGNGGCYTVPVYHNHTGNSSAVGGCYGNIPYTVNRYCGCNSYVWAEYGDGHSSCGNCWHNHGGNKCDAVTSSYVAYKIGLTCGKTNSTIDSYALGCGMTTSTVIGYSLGCGMTTSTIVAYQPGCGLSDGQIIGATIVYDQSSISTASAMNLMTTAEVAETEFSESIIQSQEESTVSGNEITPETEPTQLQNETIETSDNTSVKAEVTAEVPNLTNELLAK